MQRTTDVERPITDESIEPRVGLLDVSPIALNTRPYTSSSASNPSRTLHVLGRGRVRIGARAEVTAHPEERLLGLGRELGVVKLDLMPGARDMPVERVSRLRRGRDVRETDERLRLRLVRPCVSVSVALPLYTQRQKHDCGGGRGRRGRQEGKERTRRERLEQLAQLRKVTAEVGEVEGTRRRKRRRLIEYERASAAHPQRLLDGAA
jgi:hypothetical protein